MKQILVITFLSAIFLSATVNAANQLEEHLNTKHQAFDVQCIQGK